jgi:exopolyphosphatase/guanosine-5'-triphosphate,3'-diphosphate pyrophosphatase
MPRVPAAGQRIAVLDFGTNSTRLLVADVTDGRVEEVDRRTKVTRLGDGVDASGRLQSEAIERVLSTVAGYREAIEEHGATTTVGVATSAVRDAENGDELLSELHDRFGIDVTTISGDEEARLSFLGATSARPPGGDPLLMLDIGGGSTELVVGVPGSDPDFHVSTRAGSVRQTERHLHHDPPTAEELAAAADEVAAIVAAEVPEDVRGAAASGIAVAGTATSIAAIDQRLDPYDPERVHGYRLERAAVETILARLASVPLAERRKIPGLHPDRAPTIVAGTIILLEAMKTFGLDAMEASEADILHGAALDAADA